MCRSSDTFPRFAFRAGLIYLKASGQCPKSDEVPIAAIAGGVVGGLFGLALIIGVTVGLVCFCTKKKNSRSAGSMSSGTASVQMTGSAPADGGKV